MITRSSSSNDYTTKRRNGDDNDNVVLFSFPWCTTSAKGPARGSSEYVSGVIKSERSILERCKTRTRTNIHIYTHRERGGEEAESDEAREQVGKRDALALSMRWKEEKEEVEEEEEEEEVGRQEALARDTRTRHTINTIFALPLSPYPTPRAQPHPSIHLSIHPAVQG